MLLERLVGAAEFAQDPAQRVAETGFGRREPEPPQVGQRLLHDRQREVRSAGVPVDRGQAVHGDRLGVAAVRVRGPQQHQRLVDGRPRLVEPPGVLVAHAEIHQHARNREFRAVFARQIGGAGERVDGLGEPAELVECQAQVAEPVGHADRVVRSDLRRGGLPELLHRLLVAAEPVARDAQVDVGVVDHAGPVAGGADRLRELEMLAVRRYTAPRCRTPSRGRRASPPRGVARRAPRPDAAPRSPTRSTRHRIIDHPEVDAERIQEQAPRAPAPRPPAGLGRSGWCWSNSPSSHARAAASLSKADRVVGFVRRHGDGREQHVERCPDVVDVPASPTGSRRLTGRRVDRRPRRTRTRTRGQDRVVRIGPGSARRPGARPRGRPASR